MSQDAAIHDRRCAAPRETSRHVAQSKRLSKLLIGVLVSPLAVHVRCFCWQSHYPDRTQKPTSRTTWKWDTEDSPADHSVAGAKSDTSPGQPGRPWFRRGAQRKPLRHFQCAPLCIRFPDFRCAHLEVHGEAQHHENGRLARSFQLEYKEVSYDVFMLARSLGFKDAYE